MIPRWTYRLISWNIFTPGTPHQSFVLHPLYYIQTHKVSQSIPSVSKGLHTGGTLTAAKTSKLLWLNLGTKHLCHLLKIRQKKKSRSWKWSVNFGLVYNMKQSQNDWCYLVSNMTNSSLLHDGHGWESCMTLPSNLDLHPSWLFLTLLSIFHHVMSII